ncbi:MAG: homoserine dehydrogenase [Cyanobacteria bacterium P01_A01_bin.135]
MVFKVGLLGLGTVGAGAADILLNPEGRHPLLKEIALSKVGVRSLDKPRAVPLAKAQLTTDLSAIVSDPDVDIVVEVIGGIEPARSLVLDAINHGKHVVTANKALIARHGEEIFAAAGANGVYVLLEAAVGGGIPVIEPLKHSLCANRIHTLTGIINGTTNYILTRMAGEGGDFGPILADAQRLGYAEADPTADVDGLDAADKIAILAALAFGGRVNLEEIYCEGIRNVSAADIAYAERLNFVIKLLAIATRPANAEKLQVRVHPTLVPQGHPLASVSDVYNAILVEGEPVGQIMFYGPGAGAGPTASAVVADILNVAALLKLGHSGVTTAAGTPLLDPLLAPSHRQTHAVAPITDLVTRFYVRLLARDQPGVIGQLGQTFGDHDVSLESVVQIGMREDLAEIVVVTHEVREGDVAAAIEQFKRSEAIAEIPSVLRVL